MNPDENYVKVENNGTVYYLAEALASTVLEGDYQVLETYLGKDLEYKEYEPLFDFVKPDKNAGISHATAMLH